MRKLSVFIMLVLHANCYMFLSQGPETDKYNKNGKQVDDINSLLEYIRVATGYDKTADDEDNDNGNNFVLVKNCDIFIHQQHFTLSTEHLFAENKITTCSYQDNLFLDPLSEVVIPPPDTLA